MTERRPVLSLIDASGYLYRAFHAIRGLTGPDGRPTNATLGFATMLLKLRAQRNPDAIAVCFDRHERTFRHEMDAAYKAQRQAMPEDLVPQIEDSKELCRAMGLAVVEEPGFEADDLIATLAERGKRAGLRVEVASADKDLFQLVDGENVVVWHPSKEVVLDPKGVAEMFGAPPERVVDVLALMGDSSDNIPGVAGIGEKGAKELVAAFGSLDDIYARLDEVKGKKRESLEKGKADAYRSRGLATVRRDAPVPVEGDGAAALLSAFGVPALDADATRRLVAFYDAHGFSRLKKDLLEKSAPDAAPKAAAARAVATAPLFEAADRGVSAEASLRWETEGARLEAWVARARAVGRVAVHVECAPGTPWPASPLAAAARLSTAEDGVAFPLDGAPGRAALAALFRDVAILAHDVKKLVLVAGTLGIDPPRRLADAMLEAYVVAPGLHAHDLAGDARAVLGRAPETMPTAKEVFGSEGPGGAAAFSSEPALAYLSPRVTLPLELDAALAPALAGPAGAALRRVLDEIELPLVPVLARMERTGVAVDRAVLATMSESFGRRLADLEARIHDAAGEPFNVGSPQQLGRVLFEKLGYPVLRKTAKTKSYATDSDVLSELAAREKGPLPALVLEWREISKLKGTYVDALPNHVAPDGRIHTRFDQAVAATGRLSSNDPNLQNIPIRTEAGREIRRAFVAPPGRVLVAADYSQIELRLLAHLSRDEALVEVFRRGEDIHRATAAKIFGIDPALVTADQRRGAKTINFGILYGMGPFALAGQLGVPQSSAKEFIKAYFERFPSIRACLDAILAKARETGATETIFGRVRPIPGISDRNHAVRANAERMAMNAPFQGSAADLIKKAMIALDAALATAFPSARILLQVHDELVLEADAGEAEGVGRLARETMEGVAALAVPLVVDVGTGPNWAQAK